MINAVMVDDEYHSLNSMVILLRDHCPDVNVSATYINANDALHGLRLFTPDLVFLDIEMPGMNGFQLLERLPSIPFAIIFITSYDQYAIKAIIF